MSIFYCYECLGDNKYQTLIFILKTLKIGDLSLCVIISIYNCPSITNIFFCFRHKFCAIKENKCIKTLLYCWKFQSNQSPKRLFYLDYFKYQSLWQSSWKLWVSQKLLLWELDKRVRKYCKHKAKNFFKRLNFCVIAKGGFLKLFLGLLSSSLSLW